MPRSIRVVLAILVTLGATVAAWDAVSAPAIWGHCIDSCYPSIP